MSDENNNVNPDDIGDDWAAAMDEQASSEDDWAAAMDEQASSEDDWAAALSEQEAVDGISEDDIETAPLEYLEDDSVMSMDDDNPNLDVIMDIPVTIAMEVGSTEIAIRNLLQLNQGSVIELDRLAGEPLDVKVNGTLIAHGEVVMVNEKLGIRLTDVVSPSERIKKLR
ncbi:flagellar motor switch protein FliN/FliY [Oceanospirillum multiglobuliferum]|nr:flagellar motor switch protein FliN [Oceanospirillum multiglobuliferum]SJZ49580.1 flagellar motor switch protein FliN/FliY [Oceanospirillum multiglobuliferum]